MRKITIATLLLLAFFPAAAQEQVRFNVYFDTDHSRLEYQQRARLDSFLDAVKRTVAGRKVFIYGHCDPRGSLQYNDSLSARRVQYVRTSLIESGIIDAGQIVASAKGERQPINDNRNADEMQLNRRVEIVVGDQPTAVSLQEQIKDSTLKAGSNVILKNINFYGGRRQWLPESEPIVNELLQTMKAIPTLVIEIQGHICCEPGSGDGLDIETGVYNLSMMRAENIHNYLLANGIAADRVSWRGFGHSQPIYPYPENSDEERVANRRVEIKIIKK